MSATDKDDRNNPSRVRAQELYTSLSSGNRVALGKAITLIESRRPQDHDARMALVEFCSDADRKTLRLGISGLPGAGKSTLIERLGIDLIRAGHRVAVLAVDPSSDVSGGSILGDKTRMDELSVHEKAFVRPSPSSGVLGGVTEVSRETMILCEAAGYDVVIVETVGVGQSEYNVHSMVDFFLVVTIPGTGDVLQGIKRGIIEMADAVLVNKADEENRTAAERAASDIRAALGLYSGDPQAVDIPVMTASALSGNGVSTVWNTISTTLDERRENGEFDSRRKEQLRDWLEDAVEYLLRSRLRSDRGLTDLKTRLLAEISAGNNHPLSAASEFVDAFLGASPE